MPQPRPMFGIVNVTKIPVGSNNASSLAISETLKFFHADEFIEGTGCTAFRTTDRMLPLVPDLLFPQPLSHALH